MVLFLPFAAPWRLVTSVAFCTERLAASGISALSMGGWRLWGSKGAPKTLDVRFRDRFKY